MAFGAVLTQSCRARRPSPFLRALLDVRRYARHRCLEVRVRRDVVPREHRARSVTSDRHRDVLADARTDQVARARPSHVVNYQRVVEPDGPTRRREPEATTLTGETTTVFSENPAVREPRRLNGSQRGPR